MLMKASDNKLTPQLRFPEFKNSDEWKEKKLGELTLDINERNKTNLTKVLSVTNIYGIIEQEDFFQKIVASEDLSNYKVIRKGDIAYNPSRINVGSVDLLQKYNIGIMSPMYVIVRCKENILNNLFLKQWLISNTFYSLLEKNLQGGVRKSLPYNLFKEINILIPSFKEQRKIADFLSSVDELIMQEKIKLKELQEYKKGLLQNLFPKENQKVPDLRFPEFKNSGEWEEKKLKEYCDIIVGGDIPEKYSKEKTEEFYIPIYSNGVGNKMLYGYTNQARIYDKCVTVSARGTIGYAVYHNKPFYPIVRLLCLITNRLLSALFLKYQLDTMNIQGTQVGISQLTAPMISSYSILIPSFKEQKKISDFLSSVDELIIQEKIKLDNLQEYKKGLLQQLFPNNN